jgi:hypothetical protein
MDIFAQGRQKFDRCFVEGFKSNILKWEQKGWAQIHFIVLGDNDLREAIDRGLADGSFRAAEKLRETVQEVVDFLQRLKTVSSSFTLPFPALSTTGTLTCLR